MRTEYRSGGYCKQAGLALICDLVLKRSDEIGKKATISLKNHVEIEVLAKKR